MVMTIIEISNASILGDPYVKQFDYRLDELHEIAIILLAQWINRNLSGACMIIPSKPNLPGLCDKIRIACLDPNDAMLIKIKWC